MIQTPSFAPLSFQEAMFLTSTVSSHTAFEDVECQTFWDLLTTRIPIAGITVEIGCQIGRSSSLILQAAKAIGFYPIFIDPWTVQPDYMRQWMQMAHQISTPFTCHMMRTDQVLGLGLLDFLEIDLLLIDGDHTEHGVRIDTGMAELIKPGGLLCVHDYGRDSLPDVWNVITEYVGETPGKWLYCGTYGTLGVWKRGDAY